jgi:acetyl-CoA C-acetyltransferase
MAILARAGVDRDSVDQVIGGCINKVGAQAMNITRTAWLSSGGPDHVPCTTVDSQCGSSQYALNVAYNTIASGDAETVLACGVENLSRIPIGSDSSAGAEAGLGKPVSRSYFKYHEWTSQFEGAERIALKYGITRSEADSLGLESQVRASRATSEGRFDGQIIPLEVDVFDDHGQRTGEKRVITLDEVPRETSLDQLAKLKPVGREDAIHTAGTSSQIADGAAGVLLMSSERAASLGIRPIARVARTALVGCDPVLMLEGPVPATHKLLQKEGIGLDEVDVVEINEAFASVVLAWAKELEADMSRVNPNGGAIALGHPLGATGCFLAGKAVSELRRTGGRYGLVTMCCGGGLGTGTLFERV